MPQPEFQLATASAVDIGGRSEQQDRVAVIRVGDNWLLALADGMGGHENGSHAAQAVIDVAIDAMNDPAPSDATQLLLDIASRSNDRIMAMAEESGCESGSTCVLLHLIRRRATWAHVGDSRLYQFSRGRLMARTLDHSVVELHRLKGRINEDEMRNHPDRNRVLEALGVSPQPEIETGGKILEADDAFLICSDGLWENCENEQLEFAVGAANLQDALADLVEKASERGGADCDNISVAIARISIAG